MFWILGILFDASILWLVIKWINGSEERFWWGALLSLVFLIGHMLLVLCMVYLLGYWGLFVVPALEAAILAYAISAIYGIVMKRALLIAVLFLFAHYSIPIGFMFLLRH